MAWESFLRKTADDFELTPDQTEVFLMRFSEENKQKSDSGVQKLFEDCYQLAPEAYKKRMSGLYKKLEWSKQKSDGCEGLNNANSHKAKHLFKWLEARYADEALELENPDNSLQVNEANHLAERFNKAVQQLGGNDDWTLLSSIDELEQIAKDAEEKYYWRVMETLTMYVRKRSPWNKEKEAKAKTEQDIPSLPDDIQKVMTVLARRKYAYGHRLEPRPLDLHNTDLRRLKLYPQAQLGQVNFSGSNLQNADLKGVNLQNAHLRGVNLQEANLEGANLQRANLKGANLQQAKLLEINLQRAILWKVNLENAHLMKANLQQTCLAEANLQRALLWKANLQAANLTKAKLQKTSFKNPNPKFLPQYGSWDVVGLTWEQLDAADSYEKAILPDYLPPRQQQLQTRTA
jgi:uncharacterized protein YjbI with pentapeptide repeats